MESAAVGEERRRSENLGGEIAIYASTRPICSLQLESSNHVNAARNDNECDVTLDVLLAIDGSASHSAGALQQLQVVCFGRDSRNVKAALRIPGVFVRRASPKVNNAALGYAEALKGEHGDDGGTSSRCNVPQAAEGQPQQHNSSSCSKCVPAVRFLGSPAKITTGRAIKRGCIGDGPPPCRIDSTVNRARVGKNGCLPATPLGFYEVTNWNLIVQRECVDNIEKTVDSLAVLRLLLALPTDFAIRRRRETIECSKMAIEEMAARSTLATTKEALRALKCVLAVLQTGTLPFAERVLYFCLKTFVSTQLVARSPRVLHENLLLAVQAFQPTLAGRGIETPASASGETVRRSTALALLRLAAVGKVTDFTKTLPAAKQHLGEPLEFCVQRSLAVLLSAASPCTDAVKLAFFLHCTLFPHLPIRGSPVDSSFRAVLEAGLGPAPANVKGSLPNASPATDLPDLVAAISDHNDVRDGQPLSERTTLALFRTIERGCRGLFASSPPCAKPIAGALKLLNAACLMPELARPLFSVALPHFAVAAALGWCRERFPPPPPSPAAAAPTEVLRAEATLRAPPFAPPLAIRARSSDPGARLPAGGGCPGPPPLRRPALDAPPATARVRKTSPTGRPSVPRLNLSGLAPPVWGYGVAAAGESPATTTGSRNAGRVRSSGGGSGSGGPSCGQAEQQPKSVRSAAGRETVFPGGSGRHLLSMPLRLNLRGVGGGAMGTAVSAELTGCSATMRTDRPPKRSSGCRLTSEDCSAAAAAPANGGSRAAPAVGGPSDARQRSECFALAISFFVGLVTSCSDAEVLLPPAQASSRAASAPLSAKAILRSPSAVALFVRELFTRHAPTRSSAVRLAAICESWHGPRARLLLQLLVPHVAPEPPPAVRLDGKIANGSFSSVWKIECAGAAARSVRTRWAKDVAGRAASPGRGVPNTSLCGSNGGAAGKAECSNNKSGNSGGNGSLFLKAAEPSPPPLAAKIVPFGTYEAAAHAAGAAPTSSARTGGWESSRMPTTANSTCSSLLTPAEGWKVPRVPPEAQRHFDETFATLWTELRVLAAPQLAGFVCELRGVALALDGDPGAAASCEVHLMLRRYASSAGAWRRGLSAVSAATLAAACGIFSQVLRAVERLHGCGIVHYDLKAENVLLDFATPPADAGGEQKERGGAAAAGEESEGAAAGGAVGAGGCFGGGAAAGNCLAGVGLEPRITAVVLADFGESALLAPPVGPCPLPAVAGRIAASFGLRSTVRHLWTARSPARGDRGTEVVKAPEVLFARHPQKTQDESDVGGEAAAEATGTNDRLGADEHERLCVDSTLRREQRRISRAPDCDLGESAFQRPTLHGKAGGGSKSKACALQNSSKSVDNGEGDGSRASSGSAGAHVRRPSLRARNTASISESKLPAGRPPEDARFQKERVPPIPRFATDPPPAGCDEAVGLQPAGPEYASDVWALGCLIFELLTGEYLFAPHGGGGAAAGGGEMWWCAFFLRLCGKEELVPRSAKRLLRETLEAALPGQAKRVSRAERILWAFIETGCLQLNPADRLPVQELRGRWDEVARTLFEGGNAA